MGTARLLLLRFKNTASNSARLFSSSAAMIRRPWTQCMSESEDSDIESAVYKRALRLQRPTTVRYQESLHNSVSLIGAIEFPLRACKSDGFGVHTFLKVDVSTGANRDFRVMLTFWHELAELSVQHLKQHDLVYVSGCLGSYTKVDENGKLMQFYKVNVREVNFVAKHSLGAACQSLVKFEPEASVEDIMQKRRARLHLWQIFFSNPSEWWDNRTCKSNSRSPDFKHKDTGEALWLNNNDPPWVNQQLQLHYSRFSKQSRGPHLSPLVYDDTQET